MKFTVEELSKLDDEDLYDYLKENGKYYTKAELKKISKSSYFSSNQTNESILNGILIDIAIRKVNAFLYPGGEFRYIKLDKVKTFTPKEKINFIKNFGKYLGEYELKSLIYSQTDSSPPTYAHLLKEIYLNLQKH